MKKLILLLLHVTAVSLCQAQTNLGPGWFFSPNPTPSSAPIDTNFAPLIAGPTMPGGSNAIAEIITPEISALASSLQNDPVQIFNYVHDHIRYVHYFGSKKGAEMTLLEGSGNDMDQCALLVSLLTAAGQSPTYQFGPMYVPYQASNNQDFMHWVGTTLQNTNFTNATWPLAEQINGSRGFAFYTYFTQDTNDLLLTHTWVKLTLKGTNYLLDPSFKVSITNGGINLSSAMGLNTNTLLSDAGGTSTTNYVQSLNESNIRSDLASYTSTLLSYLQANYPNASVAQIMGGTQIVSSVGQPFGATTPCTAFTNNGTWALSTWQYIPTNLMSTITVGLSGNSQTYFMPDLRGDRLSLTFNSSGLAQFWRQDTNVFSVSTGGGTVAVALNIHHPFGTLDPSVNVLTNVIYGNEFTTNTYAATSANYALIYSFDPSVNELQHRQRQLELYQEEGYAANSQQVLDESLNVMGLSWMVEEALIWNIGAPQIGMNTMTHHRVGRMAQVSGSGYYIDVYAAVDATFSESGTTAGDTNRLYTFLNSMNYLSSALEYGVIEQMQTSNLGAVSTTKALEIANASQPIYLLTSTKDTFQFVKQPDGSFTPPASCTMTLSLTSGAFNLQERHGRTFQFNGSGLLTKIMDQYTNVNLTFTYTTANLVSNVTDWKGRQFTFTYVNSPPQMTTVSDNSGRSVSFSYTTNFNAAGDLNSITDPQSATSTFGYQLARAQALRGQGPPPGPITTWRANN